MSSFFSFLAFLRKKRLKCQEGDRFLKTICNDKAIVKQFSPCPKGDVSDAFYFPVCQNKIKDHRVTRCGAECPDGIFAKFTDKCVCTIMCPYPLLSSSSSFQFSLSHSGSWRTLNVCFKVHLDSNFVLSTQVQGVNKKRPPGRDQ